MKTVPRDESLGPPEQRARRASRSGTRVRIELSVFAVVVFCAFALSPKLQNLERLALIELAEMGAFAPVFLILGYVVVSLALLPAFPLDMAAGAHFGFLGGVFWVQIAATAGAIVGYALGRTVLRRFVDRALVRKPNLLKIQHAVDREGWKIVFLTRLSPVFSFTLLNGFYGAARVPPLPFLAATFVGMLPGTALYVYAGEMAGDLSGAPGTEEPTSNVGWVLQGAGFLATALLVIYVTRRAQRILTDKIQDVEP